MLYEYICQFKNNNEHKFYFAFNFDKNEID